MELENWLAEIMLGYKSKRSNVHIVSTLDHDRINQFVSASKELFPDSKTEFWDVNIGTSTIEIIPESLVNTLKSRKTVLIIHYLHSESQAESLTPLLFAISLNDEIFAKGSAVVVFATDEFLFPSTLLRVCNVVTPVPSTPEERRRKLEAIAGEAQKIGLRIDIGEDVVNASAGLNLKEVETVALSEIFTNKTITIEGFTRYKMNILRSYGLELVEPTISFAHIGGYLTLKEYMLNRFVQVIRDPSIAQKYGLPLPKGVLLYGLPGTGKTMFSIALAYETGLPMVKLSPDKLFHGIVGESEKAVRRVVKQIESMAPVIVFVDEADQLFITRQQLTAATDSGVTTRVVGGLLEWLSDPNRRSFVVAATNYIDRIDPAIMRPGRIDEVIPVFPPDTEAREQIFDIHTKIVRKVPVRGVDVQWLVDQTELMTGAEIEKIVLTAAAEAMINNKPYVSVEEFETAINAMRFNRSLREEKVREMVSKLEGVENINYALLNRIAKETAAEDRITSFFKNI